MRSTLAFLALGLLACGQSFEDAPFGYDARPQNATCKPPPRPSTSDSGVKLEPAWPALDFDSPLGIMQAPGDTDRYYVIEQGGTLKTMRLGDTDTTDAFTYPSGTITAGGEAGFLGFAFPPDWQTSHTAYVSRTAPGGGTGLRSVISRVKSSDNGLTFDRAAEEELLVVEQPYSNHNGGHIAFGPDGYLYIGFGDGGSGGDPEGNGQDRGTLLGKILRIDVSAPGAYTVPPDNPFVGMGGVRPEIWAWGLRNPWRWSFDRQTGELWAGDVGQGAYEEIDVIEKGGNFGWNEMEGAHCYGSGSCDMSGKILPVWEYPRSEGVSVTGGFVYRGTAIPALVGTYVFADYGSGKVWGLFPTGASGALQAQELLTTGFNVSSFGEGNDGELYVVDISGHFQKLVPSGAPGALGFPQKLSATKCMDPDDPSKPGPGLIPYQVNVPFWSDGADKERFMALPDGGKATYDDDGDLDFPNGTVFVKHFRLDGELIETRLFMRHDDGVWAGYTYEWDEDGNDATLVLGGKKKSFGDNKLWLYPSGAQCLQCHNDAAGGSLGLELRQLNRTAEYPATGRRSPQLDTLAQIGVIDAVSKGPVPPFSEALPVPYGDDATATVEQRARAWLHTNCGFCHRPNGPGRGGHDMRFGVSFGDTGMCNGAPSEGNLGVDGATILSPGKPAQSILSLRLRATDDKRMPPLASLITDHDAVELVDSWIRSVSSCP